MATGEPVLFCGIWLTIRLLGILLGALGTGRVAPHDCTLLPRVLFWTGCASCLLALTLPVLAAQPHLEARGGRAVVAYERIWQQAPRYCPGAGCPLAWILHQARYPSTTAQA
ncbi:hypothetical protein C8250_000435 [Streptomyces sp. So13.3]|uniref:hypothetical protein n=1 Tax=Streptomyces TaxID=1883 RepID=UPI001106E0B6|nr:MULTISPECIES: hypothetical protein [unclassified Streptomyces]MCZ4102211.1 hypothetical protein [Streptomyces sp. H39-C1]QNA70632.1 hypothetical protein C8250_000435 [Streptomyces sp. So13.3]